MSESVRSHVFGHVGERARADVRETAAAKDAQLASMGSQNTELLALLEDEEQRVLASDAALRDAKGAARRTAEERRRAPAGSKSVALRPF